MKTLKPGYKTTEFWATGAVDVAAFIASISGNLPAKWAAIAGAASSGLYAVSRGLTKHGASAPPPADS